MRISTHGNGCWLSRSLCRSMTCRYMHIASRPIAPRTQMSTAITAAPGGADIAVPNGVCPRSAGAGARRCFIYSSSDDSCSDNKSEREGNSRARSVLLLQSGVGGGCHVVLVVDLVTLRWMRVLLSAGVMPVSCRVSRDPSLSVR
jgi:hypothetical protein